MSMLLLAATIPVPAVASTETEQNAKVFPPDTSQRPIAAQRCSSGTSTVLELGGISRSNRHNGNDGEAHFVLKDSTTGAVLWNYEFAGEGLCFGYNPRAGVHVIGIRSEQGVGIRLGRVGYVVEAARTFRNSAVSRGKLSGFAVIPSGDARFLALIAMQDNTMGLFLLDVQRDALQRLGDAPAPPPLEAQERRMLEPEELDYFGWMGSFRDSYLTLDAGIVTFRGNTLEVSYGKDTAKQRAKARQITKWDLSQSPAKRIALAAK